MIFGKKSKETQSCENCGEKTDDVHSFCPFCGNLLGDPKLEEKNYGLLGRNDRIDHLDDQAEQGEFGITDRLINSIMNSMMKSLDKQFRQMEQELDGADIKALPNGIRIKIMPGQMQQQQQPKQVAHKKQITEGQIQKMSALPRAKAKSSVKRIGDKLVYELLTPGLTNTEDVFVSKLESGYEVKAIGGKKVYVNSIPINLPLKRYAIGKNKLLLEFKSQTQPQPEEQMF